MLDRILITSAFKTDLLGNAIPDTGKMVRIPGTVRELGKDAQGYKKGKLSEKKRHSHNSTRFQMIVIAGNVASKTFQFHQLETDPDDVPRVTRLPYFTGSWSAVGSSRFRSTRPPPDLSHLPVSPTDRCVSPYR